MKACLTVDRLVGALIYHLPIIKHCYYVNKMSFILVLLNILSTPFEEMVE
jgi:hypothetical protein